MLGPYRFFATDKVSIFIFPKLIYILILICHQYSYFLSPIHEYYNRFYVCFSYKSQLATG